MFFYNKHGKVMKNLFQWDLNQTITVKNWEYGVAPFVYYDLATVDESSAVLGTVSNGTMTVKVPNKILQTSGPLRVNIFVIDPDGAGTTVLSKTIEVEYRAKPTDYIYEDDEATLLSISTEVRRVITKYLSEMQIGGVTSEQIEVALTAYLEKHPLPGGGGSTVTITVNDENYMQITKSEGSVTVTADGYLQA